MKPSRRIGVIHAAKLALELDDESFRAILLDVAGVTRSLDLSEAQIDEVIEEFTKLGWRPFNGKPRPRQQFPGRPGFTLMASETQVNHILIIMADLPGPGCAGRTGQLA